MMTNVGVIDRALRLAIGFGLLAWIEGYLGAEPSGAVAWFAGFLGAYPAITGLIRYCPLLALSGISTCNEQL